MRGHTQHAQAGEGTRAESQGRPSFSKGLEQGWVTHLAAWYPESPCPSSAGPLSKPLLPHNYMRLSAKQVNTNQSMFHPLNNSITPSRTDLNHPNGPEAAAVLPAEKARQRL